MNKSISPGRRRLLFLSSHVGLGHVARDYAVYLLLRRLLPGIRIEWCSAEPVISFLNAVGEYVIPSCRRMESFSTVIEDLYNGRVRSLRELGSRLSILRRNWEIIEDIVAGGDYDVVFADEFWEVVYSAPLEVKKRIVFATDIVYKKYSINPVDLLTSFILNRYFKRVFPSFGTLVYLNEPEMLGKHRWYPLLGEHVVDWVRQHFVIAGLATSYLLDEIPQRSTARRRLGVDEELLIVVSVGGTSARTRALLECIDAAADKVAEILAKRLGGEARIIVLPGPRARWSPQGSTIKAHTGLVPRLVDYYAAADLFITRAGRTTTADLICLGKPAVLVPIKGHFEQEEIARYTSKRYGYPVLDEEKCGPSSLSSAILSALRRRYTVPREMCRGVEKVARLLASMLSQRAERGPGASWS